METYSSEYSLLKLQNRSLFIYKGTEQEVMQLKEIKTKYYLYDFYMTKLQFWMHAQLIRPGNLIWRITDND